MASYGPAVATPAPTSQNNGTAAAPRTLSTSTRTSAIKHGAETAVKQNEIAMAGSGYKGGSKSKSERSKRSKSKSSKSKSSKSNRSKRSKSNRSKRFKSKRASSNRYKRGGAPTPTPTSTPKPTATVPQFKDPGANTISVSSNQELMKAQSQAALDNPNAQASTIKV